MTPYVPSTEQLVTEIVVRNLRRSAEFYCGLGFQVVRDDGDFMILSWEGHHLFLGELASFHDHEVDSVDLGDPPAFPAAYLRIMVPDVDRYWTIARDAGARVLVPIATRYYGIRDFIVSDPDGFGVRFASWAGTDNKEINP